MTEETEGQVEFIQAEDYSNEVKEAQEEEIVVKDWNEAMHDIAEAPGTVLRIPRNKDFSRKQVVQAFQDAFDLIGGVPRLAVWAHTNPTDFYKLYSKMLPSQASSALGESNEMVIKHVLPKSTLDQ